MCEKETYRCKLDDRKAKQRPVPLFPTLFLNLKIYSPGKGNALIMLCRDELELWWIGGKHAQGEREPSGGTERGVPSELAGKGKDWKSRMTYLGSLKTFGWAVSLHSLNKSCLGVPESRYQKLRAVAFTMS